MFSATNLIFASLGGILPAILWLWFWLREDRLHPEPRLRIGLCFVAGMIAVLLVYPIQKYTLEIFGIFSIFTVVVWAAIEEIAKYFAASVSALRSSDFDEPIDGMIYMITAALGFSALENVFFIFGPLMEGNVMESLATGNMRFIGASVLHIASSAMVGFFISESFYSSAWKKVTARIGGIILAITLHALFNLFIIVSKGTKTLLAFSFVWIVALIVIFLFERTKRLKKETIS